MGVFKNEVGRPSNDTIKKRKVIIISLVVMLVLVISGGIFYLKDFLVKDVSSTSKNAKVKDNTIPSVSLLTATNEGIVLTAKDNVKLKKVCVTINGKDTCKSINKASVTKEWYSFKGLVEGVTYQFTVYDTSNLYNKRSVKVSDRTAPKLNKVSADKSGYLTYTASDNIALQKICAYWGGKDYGCKTISGKSSTNNKVYFKMDAHARPYVYVKDSSGNKSSTIRIYIPDSVSPVINSVSLYRSKGLYIDASDNYSITKVELYTSNVKNSPVKKETFYNMRFLKKYIFSTPTCNTSYSFFVKVYDEDGNVATSKTIKCNR